MKPGFHAYVQQAPQAAFDSLALGFAERTMRPDERARTRIRAGSHPDFLTIKPDGASIKIAQVRECLSTLSIRPFEGGRRGVVFFMAESMTAQAQNCLLKTLEEPPPDTAFLLLCERPGALLPTVRSRCMALPPAPLARAESTQDALGLIDAIRTLDPAHAAQTLPKERDALSGHLTTLLDGFGALIHETIGRALEGPAFYARCVHFIARAQQMLEANVGAALCAQWLCIQLKEENDDHRRWRKIQKDQQDLLLQPR
jgi:hypothetical protein